MYSKYYDIQHPNLRLTPVINKLQDLIIKNQLQITANGTDELLSAVENVLDTESTKIKAHYEDKLASIADIVDEDILD